MTQNERILDHLQKGKGLTRVSALIHLNIYNITARIEELRRAGHQIITRRRVDPNGQRFVEYWLGV